MLFLHPRYLSIQPFYGDRFTGMAPLLRAYQDIREDLENLESFIDQLKSPRAEQILKHTLQQELELQEMEDNLFNKVFSTNIRH